MGDRCYVTIRFSGQISVEKLPELIDAMEADGLRPDLGGELDDELSRKNNYYAEEANYGALECVEAAANRLHLSYLKCNDAGDSYEAGMELYDAVANTTFDCVTCDGMPVVDVMELIKRHNDGTVDTLIGRLKLFVDFDKHYPQLELVP